MKQKTERIQPVTIIHLDMDNFYAALEMRDNPCLKRKPVAVVKTHHRRAVITQCNGRAKALGLQAGMYTEQALSMCPQCHIVPMRTSVYRTEACAIHAILSDYTDIIEPVALDAAYLDITQSSKLMMSATLIACEIRERILSERQLTASAGIAANKLLAKVASGWNKPNGQKVVRPNELHTFMLHLPLNKITDIVQPIQKKLAHMGLKTCGDLQVLSVSELIRFFGPIGEKLYEWCRGVDASPVQARYQPQSLTEEQTFLEDVRNLSHCLAILPSMAAALASRVAHLKQRHAVQKCFVKLRFSDFSEAQLEKVIDCVDESILQHLLARAWTTKALPVRLLVVGLRLVETQEQAQLALPGFDCASTELA